MTLFLVVYFINLKENHTLHIRNSTDGRAEDLTGKPFLDGLGSKRAVATDFFFTH